MQLLTVIRTICNGLSGLYFLEFIGESEKNEIICKDYFSF